MKLTDRKEWKHLKKHHQEMMASSMRDLFAEDPLRASRLSCQVAGIQLDYSRNIINDHTLKLLFELAEALALNQQKHGLFKGALMNVTENRPALHTALRDLSKRPLFIKQQNIALDIELAVEKMREFVSKVHTHAWKGATGKPIEHIVNIGIGGSHLGPMMTIAALKDFALPFKIHFISSVDDMHVEDVLECINPETTLFLISSKSFSTLETLDNAHKIRSWMKAQLGDVLLAPHFVAVTACADKAIAWGVLPSQIFPLWEWVGGRYSIWSAVGLSLRLMIGNDHFEDFLAGAFAMDQHFLQADFKENMPVILAVLSIWYSHFFNAKAQAIVPYSYRLRHLIAYLQQVEMESNGKSIDLAGNPIDYPTGSILFGQEGCNGQHAFHQLLHQGQHFIPVDFMVLKNHPNLLLQASAYAQADALMYGKNKAEITQELKTSSVTEAKTIAPHKVIPGNRPSNILLLDALTPKILGALLALYEHKTFVQSVIYQINPFDQWGVELGKQLLPSMLKRFAREETHD